ncbi:ABC transporter permease [Raoultibacter phocaeensis]|uniref:ABC transporter permease n=1 Tax=Raoultibacter phocaeensis TaxID=2479841 RepID=UPI002101F6F2|nr:ABC transporter permease [Raoultibacter phocaeensis]
MTIAKKELARFFSNKASALVAIVLPGLLIFGMWSIMGSAMSSMFTGDENEPLKIAVVDAPASIEQMTSSSGMEIESIPSLPDPSAMREQIDTTDVKAFAVFPAGFDEDVATFDTASGSQAPQVEIYYNSADTSSSRAFATFVSLLDTYESSLSNRFDVNAGDAVYDVAEDKDLASTFIVSIVPMLLLILLFSGCMSVASESVAGEKERGTMATMLATPIKRSDIALGKILALSLIGLAIAASSAIGIFASLPNLVQGELDINVYGPPEYLLLALVIFSTTLLVVMLITVVSAIAKTTKEAQLYLTPLMIVVMVIGLMGMFGDGAKPELGYYFIPLYNSVQCMIGIFTFDFQPAAVVACVVSNLVYTGIGVFVLQKMFKSERLMFAR